MAKANDEQRRGREPAQVRSSEPSAAQQPSGGAAERPYPTLLDRINNLFGHLVGSSGRRRGARDTDPGH
jgi:hypothetical protein